MLPAPVLCVGTPPGRYGEGGGEGGTGQNAIQLMAELSHTAVMSPHCCFPLCPVSSRLKSKKWVNEQRWVQGQWVSSGRVAMQCHERVGSTQLSCTSRYGGFSLGAGGSQLLPSAEEVSSAVQELRELFNVTQVQPGSVPN